VGAIAMKSSSSGDRKKLMILGGLGLVLVVVVVIRVAFPAGGAGVSTAQASENGAEFSERSPLDHDPSYLATVAKIARVRLGTAYEPEIDRDPMAPLARERTTRTTSVQRSEQPAPVTCPVRALYGIVWDPETPVAMLDGQDARVGDTVKGAKVIEIDIDRVVLSYRSQQFTLTVE